MRKNNYIWKKLFAAFVSMGLLLGTAGCGNVSNEAAVENESKDTANAAEVESADAADNAGEDGGTIDLDAVEEFTIRVGVCSGDTNQYLKILDNHTNFLKERGINLEITEFSAGINTIDAITLNQLDVGLFADYAGVNRIGNTLANTELRAFAVIQKTSSFSLYVNPEKISEPEDLYDATLVSQAGVVYEYDYGKLFEHFGLDASRANYANVGSVQEALALAATGEGDSWWSSTQTNAMFEEYGWEPFVTVEDVDAMMYTYLVANDSYLTEHKEEVAKFLAVSDEAFAYISENLDEFAGWVESDLGLSKDLVILGWESAEHGYTFEQDAYEDLAKVEKWCYENGNFDTEYDVADYINTDALELAFPERVTWSAD